jgi:hypothetical protein
MAVFSWRVSILQRPHLGELLPDQKGSGDWQLTIGPSGCRDVLFGNSGAIPARGAVPSRTTSRQLRNGLSKQTWKSYRSERAHERYLARKHRPREAISDDARSDPRHVRFAAPFQ